jgi:hypothetical protein
MKKLIVVIAAMGLAAPVSLTAGKPADQTWKGKISDSMCKEKHPAGEHEGKKMNDADCVGVCIRKGAKYVFVTDGKVYQIANQNSKQIATHAGQMVELTGELKGDTITAKKLSASK